MLEKTIQSNIIKYLRSLPNCEAENVHGNTFSRGRPDINACFRGRLIRIEVKTPDNGNKPSKLQEDNLKVWSRSKAICFVAYSLDEVKYVVSEKGVACRDKTLCQKCPVDKRYCYTRLRR